MLASLVVRAVIVCSQHIARPHFQVFAGKIQIYAAAAAVL